MAELFLKSEVAKKNEQSTKRAFYEIPDGILISQEGKLSNVRFFN